MIRGGLGFRIGGPMLCALAAVAVAAPATASGQAAVDEYTLSIPGGGGTNPGDPTAPTAASASGKKGGGERHDGGSKDSGHSGAGSTGSGTSAESGELGADGVNLASLQEGSGHAALPTTSRSAPEVAADSLTSSSMLPILGALALITAGGAWRLLRTRRRTLTGMTS